MAKLIANLWIPCDQRLIKRVHCELERSVREQIDEENFLESFLEILLFILHFISITLIKWLTFIDQLNRTAEEFGEFFLSSAGPTANLSWSQFFEKKNFFHLQICVAQLELLHRVHRLALWVSS